jgi:hypothetical protein
MATHFFPRVATIDTAPPLTSGLLVTVAAMTAVRVPWSSAAFLAYVGGLTILFATGTMLAVQSDTHGSAGLAFWALVIFVAVTVLALAAKRAGRLVTAGLLAISSVVAFVVVLGALLDWFGWFPNTDSAFSGFRFWLIVLELAAIVASAVALRIFRFPLLVLLLAVSIWFFVTDLISGGGDWSAVVTIVVGLAFLLAGIAVDVGPSRPFGFWLHVAAGLTIGGGLLWFLHDSTFDWIVVAVAGVLYILFGARLGRSSWAVLGAWGILQTATFFSDKWSDVGESFAYPLFFLAPFLLGTFGEGEYHEHRHNWIGPLIYAFTGLVFIAIALWLGRRSRPPLAEI